MSSKKPTEKQAKPGFKNVPSEQVRVSTMARVLVPLYAKWIEQTSKT